MALTSRDRAFALWVLAATVVVPGLLVLVRPIDEPQAELGLMAGWGVALLVMVPSYMLLRRALASTTSQGFLGAFLGGTFARLVITVVAILLFIRFVPEAPKWSFVASYFAGYFVLTAIELSLTVGRQQGGQPNGSAA